MPQFLFKDMHNDPLRSFLRIYGTQVFLGFLIMIQNILVASGHNIVFLEKKS